MYNLYSISKHLAIETFKRVKGKAQRRALLAKLAGKTSRLNCFQSIQGNLAPQRRYLGFQQIPATMITGTMGRGGDFDSQFRPLKAHLRDRWVQVAIRSGGAGWLPIQVLKINQDYYVVDGHHRVSFARSTGMSFLDAEVWELTEKTKEEQEVFVPPPEIYLEPVPLCAVAVSKPEDQCIVSPT
jgi:hypothetical protein